jgi:hypothetical protein
MRAIYLIAFLIYAGVACADDAQTRRMLEIIQTRLEPAHRDRVLTLWNDTRERPALRQRLAQALEGFDGKMKPDWTGLLIAGGVTGVGAGIGAGVLAAKLGAAGMVAGPIGAVAGVAAGALIGYSVHAWHQRKALSGGMFSRTGRRLGIKGKGLEGDLLRIEAELRRPAPAAPAAPAAAPPAPRRRWYDRFRRRQPQAAAPVEAPAPAAPAAPARRDDPNADDVHRSMNP